MLRGAAGITLLVNVAGRNHGVRSEAIRGEEVTSPARAASRGQGRVPRLERSAFEAALAQHALTIATWVTAILASVPLLSVLYMLAVRAVSTEPGPLHRITAAGFEMAAASATHRRSLVMSVSRR